jgi:hypothetical protein
MFIRSVSILLRYETCVAWAHLPSPKIRDVRFMGPSPFFFIRNWTIAIFIIVSIRISTQDFRNCTHFSIFSHRTSETAHTSVYFTQISNKSYIFTQMGIFSNIEHISHKYPIKLKFSHIEHILHKYPLKVKFLHKWSYFHTFSIFYTYINKSYIFTEMGIFSNIEHISHKYPIKLKFSHNEHILHKYPLKVKISHKWSYFHTLIIFYTIILLLSVAVLVFWNSRLFHGARCTSIELRWSMVFLALSSRWRKEESHQIDQTLPQRRHSQLWRFIIF